MIKAIFGIGNPGKEYENTYHNVGKNFLKFATKDFESSDNKNISNIKIFQSDLFMNESGMFVAKKLRNTNVKTNEIAIAHDDSDLNIGSFKIDFDINSAGHKGIESIIQNLETKKFWRIRIGIRPQVETRRMKAEEFVLNNINKEDLKSLESVFLEIEKYLILATS
ncbi:MAG: peptidyl-tRNA hydrolase [Candidatus Pacebacteria bacterium]|nr:peptidyl-tRNA hydrolase [Candidatus Paceibacterota bacterium]